MNPTIDELFPPIFPQLIPMCEFLSFVLKVDQIREKCYNRELFHKCITGDKIVGKTVDINWNYSE